MRSSSQKPPGVRPQLDPHHIVWSGIGTLILVTAVGTWTRSTAWAQATAATGVSVRSAAEVGDTRLALEDLQAIVDRSAPARLSSPQERLNWIKGEVVPQLRLTQYAHTTLQKDARYSTLRNEALTQALEESLLETELSERSPSGAVEAYYQKFKDRFQQPEAILVWRLLVATEEQANNYRRQVLGSDKATETWRQLVREHSVDQATRQRSGSLGFVQPDGTTDVPQVRVARVVHKAVASLRDGDLAPRPVKEGDYWAVVWRRGTRAARLTTLEQARPEIEQQLALHEARSARLQLIERLRAQHLSEHTPDLLEAIDYPAEQGIPGARISTQAKAAEQNPGPQKTDRGER